MNARRILRTLFLTVMASFLLIGIGAAILARQIRHDLEESLPDLSWLKRRHLPGITTVYSREGKIVGTLSKQRRKVVGLDQVSPFVLRALIATEDARFYEHDGVDRLGILRAAWSNLRSGHTEEGASTITMQLVRHYFYTQEHSYWRKFQEALLAQRLERMFSKEEILIRYLNEVYFGAGAYGIQSAAATYFGKSARDLTATEAALLIGLLQSPSQLSPYHNPDGARERTMAVLQRMRGLGYISVEEQLEGVRRYQRLAPKKPLQASNLTKYPYFTNYAISLVARQLPQPTLYEHGLAIRTTLDIRQQRILEREVAAALSRSGPAWGADSAAAVLIHNRTGEVRAMVGGRRWSPKNGFNRAWQSRLQVGSAFKAILYATALNCGLTPETVVSDDPVTVSWDDGSGAQATWEPANYDHTSKGDLPLREALKLSRNTVAARLVCETGIDSLVVMAHQMGIKSPLPEVPSLALGVAEVSPLEMATAFSTIARGGMYLPPVAVRAVMTPQGTAIPLEREGIANAMRPEAAAELTEMLMRVVEEGTGQAARLWNVQVAGKTGTTDSYRDAWFVGFTPTYTLAVWVGNDDHRPTYGMTGGTLPASLWRQIMSQVEARPERSTFAGFQAQPSLVALCRRTHRLKSPTCPNSYSELFWYTTPADTCDSCQAAPARTARYPQAVPVAEPAQPSPDLELEEAPEPSFDEPTQPEPVVEAEELVE